jgi:hypothetical protein
MYRKVKHGDVYDGCGGIYIALENDGHGDSEKLWHIQFFNYGGTPPDGHLGRPLSEADINQAMENDTYITNIADIFDDIGKMGIDHDN